MQKQRKIPQRQCVGCRTMKDKKALVRIVKTPEGEICVDATGKKSGRGAYICPDAQCLQKARKSRALERAFETAIGEDIYAALQAQIEGTENRITVARREFNEATQAYNVAVRKFPAVIIAKIFSFEQKPYFEADESAAEAPKVEF